MYELKKPITDKQRADFITEYSYAKGLNIVDTEYYLFALEKNEIMGEKEIEIVVPDFDDDGNPIGEHTETIVIPYPVINPNYEQEQIAKREQQFNTEFFQTSLGYIRRLVTMQNGAHKDFLSDLLPAISASVQMGQAVNIIAYDKPPFNKDVTDWTQYQHIVTVTPQFIQECFLQLGNDFLPINED